MRWLSTLSLPALSLAIVAAFPAGPALAQDAEPAVNLRPIDRATVRILSLRGLDVSRGEGRTTHVTRVAANPLSSHGSGVVIGPRLVLTARHVVWSANAWVVFAPNSNEPIAARPLYVDPDRDIAFLTLDSPLEEVVTGLEERRLTLSERVSVSGYPLDLRETIPAAASGEVSRVTRNGDLHLTMTVNPGHSGGPVIDAEGHLVGILSARGRMDRGVEGLAIAVPMRQILAARGRLPSPPPTFTQVDRDVAQVISVLADVEDRPLHEQSSSVALLIRRAVSWEQHDPDRDALAAALAWNTLLGLLEERRAADVENLPPADRDQAALLQAASGRLARRALENGPHVRRLFPILRAISIGRTDGGPTDAQ
ncbi:MAG: serine protease [Sandaracinaceae bacterium]